MITNNGPVGPGRAMRPATPMRAAAAPQTRGPAPIQPVRARAAANDPPADPPAPGDLGGAVDAYMQALDATRDRTYPDEDARLRDPAVKQAAAWLDAALDGAIAEGRVSDATRAVDQVVARAPVPDDRRDAFKLAFARARAATAYQAAGRPTLGVNHSFNPYYRPEYQAANSTTDLAAAEAAQRKDLRAELARVAARGYGDVRYEIWTDGLPPVALARAYETWKDGGRFPHGRTVADFAASLRDPAFQQALAAAGTPLDDAALAALDRDDLPATLTYLALFDGQLAALADRRGRPAVSLITSLGDYDHQLAAGESGRFDGPTPAGEAYMAGIAEQIRYVAGRAAPVGVGTIELHNEPNLGGEGGFWSPNANDPTSITNAARRYAYAEGVVYQALKADPATSGLTVNAASMGFTNDIDPPFYPLSPSTTATAARFLRGADDATLQRFVDLNDRAAAAEAAGNADGAQGYVDAMWNVYHQMRQQRDPAFDPTHPQNDGAYFLEQMHAAQQDFFGLGPNDPVLTDQLDLHFYGTPRANERLIAAYGELAARGILPTTVDLSEFGSRLPVAGEQATDLYTQYAELLAMLRGHGFSVAKAELFAFHDFGGWGVGGNQEMDVSGIGGVRVQPPAPVPTPAPAPAPTPTPAPAPGFWARLWAWLRALVHPGGPGAAGRGGS